MVSAHTANRLRHGRHRASRGLRAGVKLAFVYSPRGFCRLVAMFSKWAYDWDTAKQRHEWAGKLDTSEAVKAHNMRRHNLKARVLVISAIGMPIALPILAWVSPGALGILVGVTLALWVSQLIPGKDWREYVAAAGIGLFVGAKTAGVPYYGIQGYAEQLPAPPWWALAILAAGALVALGIIGKPIAKPVLKSNVLPPHVVPPLRAPMVSAALCTLGNAKMSQKTEDDPATPPNGRIQLLMDVARQGPGYQVDLELPAGVPAAFVQRKREEFAAALRRELGTVWPSVGMRHPGHLSLYVCDLPMSRAPQEPWPLLESGGIDLGAKFPAYTNQRGEWVSVRLAYANLIIGSIPRMGKTFDLRKYLLASGLDRRARGS